MSDADAASAGRPVAELAGVAVGGEHPVRLMGIVNVSPESFYPGSVQHDEAALHDSVQRMVGEGADFIDVGAMSTAPYRQVEIPEAEELRRMAWAIRVASGATAVPISVDSKRSAVVAAAVEHGARILNDVTGLRGDPRMAEIATRMEGLVLMAAEEGPVDREPVDQVLALLERSLEVARHAGVARSKIVLDPGIGFFTHQVQSALVFNSTILNGLGQILELGCPLLVGVSRKAFLGKITGRDDPGQRLAASLGASAFAVLRGAAILRTHDVAATSDAVRVVEAILSEGRSRS